MHFLAILDIKSTFMILLLVTFSVDHDNFTFSMNNWDARVPIKPSSFPSYSSSPFTYFRMNVWDCGCLSDIWLFSLEGSLIFNEIYWHKTKREVNEIRFEPIIALQAVQDCTHRRQHGHCGSTSPLANSSYLAHNRRATFMLYIHLFCLPSRRFPPDSVYRLFLCSEL
jgi:hypothetical protein